MENLTIYDLQNGLGTSIVRALTPLHAMTAMVIASWLAHSRFSGWKTEQWYKTILLPMFIHGSFDFSLSFMRIGWAVVTIVTILVSTALYLRAELNKFMRAFPEEVDTKSRLENIIPKEKQPTWGHLLRLIIAGCVLTPIWFVLISLLVPPSYSS